MHLCFMLWYDHATIHSVFFPFFLIDSCDLTEDYNDVRRGETLVMLPLPVRLLATLRSVSPSTLYFVFTSIFNLFCNAVYVFQYMFPSAYPVCNTGTSIIHCYGLKHHFVALSVSF